MLLRKLVRVGGAFRWSSIVLLLLYCSITDLLFGCLQVELTFRVGDVIYVYGDMDEDGFFTVRSKVALVKVISHYLVFSVLGGIPVKGLSVPGFLYE